MYKSFKYRIYPNEEQRILLEKHFGCTRFVYNYFLDYKQTQYKTTGTSGTYNQIAKELINLKEDSNYSWLKEVNSQSLQQSLKHISYRPKSPTFCNRKFLWCTFAIA